VTVEGGLPSRRVLSASDGDALVSGQLEREAFVIQEEAQLWRERYRALFDKNVAGVILTTPEGRIVDSNEACAQIFGFDSREEMLGHSAWDFYFNRSERETLLDRFEQVGVALVRKFARRVGMAHRSGFWQGARWRAL